MFPLKRRDYLFGNWDEFRHFLVLASKFWLFSQEKKNLDFCENITFDKWEIFSIFHLFTFYCIAFDWLLSCISGCMRTWVIYAFFFFSLRRRMVKHFNKTGSKEESNIREWIHIVTLAMLINYRRMLFR